MVTMVTFSNIKALRSHISGNKVVTNTYKVVTKRIIYPLLIKTKFNRANCIESVNKCQTILNEYAPTVTKNSLSFISKQDSVVMIAGRDIMQR